MSSKPAKQNGRAEDTATIKSVTPNGRILYDATSILESEAARRHFETLDRLVKLGVIVVRNPAPAKK
jgi:hypothetical protein